MDQQNKYRLNSFVLALFITSIAAVIYPMLSKISNNENKDDFINKAISEYIENYSRLVIYNKKDNK